MTKPIYDFGQVVLAPIQYTDGSTEEIRPAVVVSSLEYNAARRDVIVAAITTRLHQIAGFGVLINNWQEAGLDYESAVKPVLATIILSDIRQVLGRLDQQTRRDLRIALAKIFGFNLSSTARAPRS
jgi:mRNA-degrading endonuclease toxin of MazEF toxin-antitoxin module